MPLLLVIDGYHKGQKVYVPQDRKTFDINRDYHPAMKLGDRARTPPPHSSYRVGVLVNKYNYLKFQCLYPADWHRAYAEQQIIRYYWEHIHEEE